jgi:hypothetical protein
VVEGTGGEGDEHRGVKAELGEAALKSEMVTFLISTFLQILQVDFLKQKEQLFFLDHL